jgi:hypothetical protein
MLVLVANIHMRDSGPSDLNQDLLCEPSVLNILRTEYSFCMKIPPSYKFIVQCFAQVRMICSEDGEKFTCAHCTHFSGASAAEILHCYLHDMQFAHFFPCCAETASFRFDLAYPRPDCMILREEVPISSALHPSMHMCEV